MVKLGVNVDHIATLRQARKGNFPDPVKAALICEKAGADSIVAHLREDRRHINDNDIRRLKKAVKTRFNMEMSIAQDVMDVACFVKPDQVTLVPERRQELTTEGGLDIIGNRIRLTRAIKKLSNSGVEVSLFIDPDKKQISRVWDVGAKIIEIHTGAFAEAKTKIERARRLKEISAAVSFARGLGLRVFAGHGLDYANVLAISKISGIEEFNIGYSIICRSVFVGLAAAVKEMKALI